MPSSAHDILTKAFGSDKNPAKLAFTALTAIYGSPVLHIVESPIWSRETTKIQDTISLDGWVDNEVLRASGTSQRGWGFESSQWESYRAEEIRTRYLALVGEAIGLETSQPPPPWELAGKSTDTP